MSDPAHPPSNVVDPDKLLATPGRTIRFACTACGKCCNHAPMMTLDEGYALSDVFILSPELWFGPGDVDTHDTGHPHWQPPDVDFELALEMHVRALNWSRHIGACLALDGKLCGIYERRPQMCRVVPFDMHLKPELVSRSPMFDEQIAAQMGFECDWSDAAPVIVAPEGVVDAETRADYEKGRELIRATQERLDYVPEHAIVQAWQHFRRDQTAETILPLVPLLLGDVATGRLSSERAKEILENQIRLIDAQETEALERRIPEERPTTNHIREIRKEYRQALETFDDLVAEVAGELANA